MSKTFELKKKMGHVKMPDGKMVEIRIPPVHEALMIQEKIKEAPAADAIKILEDFYISLGLSEEDMKIFDGDDYHDFFVFLLASKKN